MNISRCCKLRGKSFNWLVKRWHRNSPKFAAGGRKCCMKWFSVHWSSSPCTVTLFFLWTWRRSESVPWECSLLILSISFQSNISFHWHRKWNNPVSSSLKLRSERNLSWQSPTGTRAHVDVHLKTQQHIVPFILNFNCSNYGICAELSASVSDPGHYVQFVEPRGKIWSGWSDDRFGSMCSLVEVNWKNWDLLWKRCLGPAVQG